MGGESLPHPNATLIIWPSSFSGNGVALRLSRNLFNAAHGFHLRLSNATAPQLRRLARHAKHVANFGLKALVRYGRRGVGSPISRMRSLRRFQFSMPSEFISSCNGVVSSPSPPGR